MADLKLVDQHNMVACLEKTEENAEFYQIVDFLSTCSINYALTVSPSIYASYIEQFWNTVTSKTVNSVKQIHAIIDGKAVVISESSGMTSVPLDHGADEAVYKEGGDSVERAITTDASLVTTQDSDNILKTQSTAMSNDPLSQEIGSGDSLRRQETIGGALAQTRFKRVLETPNEPPLSEGHTSGSGEGNMEHIFELMDTVPPIPHDSP
ncbi:hypothetical protein Tco_1416668, partial [Tanacetum coccineum]